MCADDSMYMRVIYRNDEQCHMNSAPRLLIKLFVTAETHVRQGLYCNRQMTML